MGRTAQRFHARGHGRGCGRRIYAMADSGQHRLRRLGAAGGCPRRPGTYDGRAAPGDALLPEGGRAVYLVDIRLESAARLSPADVRGLLSRAALPGDGVEHIYVQPSRPPCPAPMPPGQAPLPPAPAPLRSDGAPPPSDPAAPRSDGPPPPPDPAPPRSDGPPPPSDPAPLRDAALCLDAVLFLSHLTLTESERAADALLERCTRRGLRLRRLSAIPLTLLVELLALEG